VAAFYLEYLIPRSVMLRLGCVPVNPMSTPISILFVIPAWMDFGISVIAIPVAVKVNTSSNVCQL